MTQSENENDHFDLDHFDQHFGEPAHAGLRFQVQPLTMNQVCHECHVS